MDSLHHAALTKHFYERRLQPNIEEHALFIEAELAKLKVLDEHDYKNFKAHYDSVLKERKAEAVKVEEVVKEAIEDGEVTMADLQAIAAAKNANAAPVPEDADGEEEEKKREEILALREEIEKKRIDTPLGEGAVEEEEEEEEEDVEEDEKEELEEKLSESEFKSLSAAEQKELVADKEGDKSNADKRFALYSS